MRAQAAVFGVVLSLVLQGLLLAAAQQPYAAHRPAIVLFGDSLTEFGWGNHWKYRTDKKGWAALLADAYSRKADVINRGFSGYNSRWALQVLPQVLSDLGCSAAKLQQQQRSMRQGIMSWVSSSSSSNQQQQQRCNAALLTIFFGTNDAIEPGSRPYVPLKEYQNNLVAMVNTARRAGVQRVVLVTPPPMDEAAWAKEHNAKASDRTNARTAQYAAAARNAAAQLGVPLLDLQASFNPTTQGGSGSSSRSSAELQKLLVDGLHFSPEGNQRVAKLLLELIEKDGGLAGVRAAALPVHLPPYDQVDAADPQKTFRELFQRN